MGDREHLFRDESGAAVERAARLQEENQQLRMQLAHERSARKATTVRKPRKSAANAALVAVILLFVLGVGGGVAAALVVRRAAPVPVSLEPTTDMTSGTPFDRAAAATVLSEPQLQTCKTPDGPTGSGHVKITFANDGSVSSVVLDSGPFAGTSTAACITERFRAVRVPAFNGAPVTVGKSFTIN